MSKAKPIECPMCNTVVLRESSGVLRMHYERGTNTMCPGSDMKVNDNGEPAGD